MRTTLMSWGANQYGQLAHMGWPICDQCETPQPCDLTGLPEGLADKLCLVCGGGGHTLLLDWDGRVWACGLNNKGQCGQQPQTTTAPGNVLRPWHQVLTGGSKVVHVAAGWEHTLALTEEGVLLGWGSNSHGQLGDMLQRGGCTHVPVEVSQDVQQVAAGLRHSAWVTKDGKLRTCGSLGNKQIEVPEFLQAQKVACGQRHLLALMGEELGAGQGWGVGDNRHGQLGCDPATLASSPNLTVAQRLADLRFNNLSSGWSHAAAITGDGQVVCWGRGTYGQLGVPPSDQETQPVLWPAIHSEQGVRLKPLRLALGSEHTLVLLDSGRVLSCGWNEHGNCGTGDLKDVHSPRLVLQGASVIGCGAAHCFAVVSDLPST